jgi:hypothetical protein
MGGGAGKYDLFSARGDISVSFEDMLRFAPFRKWTRFEVRRDFPDTEKNTGFSAPVKM